MELEKQAGAKSTIEEIFSLFPLKIRRHCIRSADYIKVLFEAATAAEMELVGMNEALPTDKRSRELMLAARYNIFGLLLQAEDGWERLLGMTQEEIARGKALLDQGNPFDTIRQDVPDITDKELEEIRSIVMQFHRLYNTEGFPLEDAPLISASTGARLLANAIRLDRLSSESPVEEPYEMAYEAMMELQTAEEYRLAIRLAKAKLKKVFKKHCAETEMLQVPTPLVKRRASRPLELLYSPVRQAETGEIHLLAAFNGYKNGSSYLDANEVEIEFNKDNSTQQLFRYYLYEAADFLLRLDAHKLGIEQIELAVPRGAFTQGYIKDEWQEFAETVGMPISRFIFCLNKFELDSPGPVFITNLEYLRDQGAVFSVRGLDGDRVTISLAQQMAVKMVTVSEKLADSPDDVLDLAAEAMDARLKVVVPVLREVSPDLAAEYEDFGVKLFREKFEEWPMTEENILAQLEKEKPYQ